MSEIYELYLEDSWNDVRLIKYCSSMLEDPSRVHLRSLRIPTGFNPGEKASVLLAEVVGWAPLESLSLDCSDSFFKSCPELAYALASSLGIRYLHLGLSSAGYMTLRWLSQMESQPREIKLSNLEIHNQLSYWQLLQPFIDSLQVLRVEGFDRFDTGNGLVWPRVCILEVGCMADFSQLSRAFPAVQDLVVIDTKVGLDFNCDIPRHTEWANLDCIAYWTRTAVVPLQCHTRLLDLHEWRMNSRANECYADLTQLAQAAPLMQYLNIFFDHTDAESLECVVGQLYVLDGLALAGITLYTSSPLHVSDCVYQNWAQEAAALVSSLTKITFGDVSDDEHYVMFCITRAEGSVPEVERKSSSEEFNAQCDLLKPGCSANWSNTVCIQ